MIRKKYKTVTYEFSASVHHNGVASISVGSIDVLSGICSDRYLQVVDKVRDLVME